MHTSKMLRPLPYVVMRSISLPSYFVSKTVLAEHGVHHELEVVAGCGIAVEVDAARRLQDAVEFGHALGHHGEVGHHVVLAEEAAHGLEKVAEFFRGRRL